MSNLKNLPWRAVSLHFDEIRIVDAEGFEIADVAYHAHHINAGQSPANDESAPILRDVFADEHDEIAYIMAAAPELLGELMRAHGIIKNALAIMSPAQKLQWVEANWAEELASDASVRNEERWAAICKAQDGAQ